MNELEIITHTTEETMRLAEELAQLVRPGDVITLEGDLGAGKTTFTKGLGSGLGVTRTINSPTYTIVKEYRGELPLYHMDVYRLEDSDEDIGFDEYFHSDGISVVEWASFIEAFLPEKRLDIVIRAVDEHTRKITFYPRGDSFEKICEELAR
ncbi:tRNA (adenosine(37)-N6)-threonylcarbamoyltransferase complex ATPase subunit type 1 TsaE [Aquibacillus koreensis]|uniref:tRNA threonylcarbamoyladenosine biosynthesis protein TsaE n=1 Tax=Aquibacillus koreensis TaxID=279446 RepID=A0A9X3WNR1_9BACI|nr:tRNA (adenosine(37)-N6)-threonylcarbamoyltransferase complex ATPase subunit type 1 TsaE [Aquibacillus koreensis]MCT2536693.1 tRNA (adenosine(37)-N6)-threonylcarbamoyltransferase complex ATPase subunit type 1 TsaE [Aquibacillus koreensis]MDC3421551.1 tRNA (adenosine(37)-N6)-threonylcarbamoyltransferase complex ATPase subunit type 1 TsaE [Aquibacillus koreensis]